MARGRQSGPIRQPPGRSQSFFPCVGQRPTEKPAAFLQHNQTCTDFGKVLHGLYFEKPATALRLSDKPWINGLPVGLAVGYANLVQDTIQ